MNNKILTGVVILNALATAAIGVSLYINKTSAAPAGDSAAIEKWVNDNPQKIVDSVNTFMQGQAQKSEEQTMELVKQNHAFLYEDNRHPHIGNPKGDVTIVEFLDYNCGYCKKAYESVSQTLDADKNVRVVLIEIPILHETSALAARWALAAHDDGGYAVFHKKLMEHKGPITEEVLTQFATDAGLDATKVKAKSETPEIAAILDENLKKSQELGIQGTPGFIIGEQLFRGYIDSAAMKSAVETARKAQ